MLWSGLGMGPYHVRPHAGLVGAQVHIINFCQFF